MKVTRHANKRIRERMGLNKKSVDNIAALALEKGLKQSETTGRLRKYMDYLYYSHVTANNIRLYSQKVFIFHNTILITVFKLPNEYIKAFNKLSERKKELRNAS